MNAIDKFIIFFLCAGSIFAAVARTENNLPPLLGINVIICPERRGEMGDAEKGGNTTMNRNDRIE